VHLSARSERADAGGDLIPLLDWTGHRARVRAEGRWRRRSFSGGRRGPHTACAHPEDPSRSGHYGCGHRPEIRIDDHDGVAELPETVGDSPAPGRGLDQHAGRRAPSQHLSKSLMLGSDASFLVVATLGADADLAVDLMDVDSDVFHPSAPSSPA